MNWLFSMLLIDTKRKELELDKSEVHCNQMSRRGRMLNTYKVCRFVRLANVAGSCHSTYYSADSCDAILACHTFGTEDTRLEGP